MYLMNTRVKSWSRITLRRSHHRVGEGARPVRRARQLDRVQDVHHSLHRRHPTSFGCIYFKSASQYRRSTGTSGVVKCSTVPKLTFLLSFGGSSREMSSLFFRTVPGDATTVALIALAPTSQCSLSNSHWLGLIAVQWPANPHQRGGVNRRKRAAARCWTQAGRQAQPGEASQPAAHTLASITHRCSCCSCTRFSARGSRCSHRIENPSFWVVARSGSARRRPPTESRASQQDPPPERPCRA